MRLHILASGSKANAAVLDTGHLRVLIDAGLSAAQLETRLRLAGIEPESLAAILLTHEHADHAAGLARFVKRYPAQVYANALTAQALSAKGVVTPWQIFRTGQGFQAGSLHVETFPVYHDAADPCGFLFTPPNGPTLAFATDLGEADAGLIERCQRATTLFIESNYHDDLLDHCDRPYSVIERIRSQNGHLSNAQAADAICELPKLRKAILGHLSAATNNPGLAVQTVGIATAGEVEVEVAFTPETARHLAPQSIVIL